MASNIEGTHFRSLALSNLLRLSNGVTHIDLDVIGITKGIRPARIRYIAEHTSQKNWEQKPTYYTRDLLGKQLGVPAYLIASEVVGHRENETIIGVLVKDLRTGAIILPWSDPVEFTRWDEAQT